MDLLYRIQYQKKEKEMKKRRVNQYDGHFRSFNKARKFVHSLKLKNVPDWEEYRKSDKIPFDIPGTPNRTYKKEWISYGDWLGTGKIAQQVKSVNYLPVNEAIKLLKKLAKKYQIKNRIEWEEFAKTHNELLDSLKIPIHIMHVYSKEKVWSRMKK